MEGNWYPESEYSMGGQEGRGKEIKEYSEGLHRFFVIVWPIKINGHEEGRNLIGQIYFDRMTSPLY